MGKSFRLAGLLRFRQAQEEQAAATLARANARRKEHAGRVGQIRTTLAATATDPSSVAALRASAAARSSARSMLLEMQAVTETTVEAVAQAQTELSAAKKSAAALENLAERHKIEQQQILLREEQIFLDQLAASRAPKPGTPDHLRTEFA